MAKYAYTYGPLRVEIEAEDMHEADRLLDNTLSEWFPDGKLPSWAQFEVEYSSSNNCY